MFALFAVAGIFLAVCRHGHVLVICDMIHSGELYVFFSRIFFFHSNSLLLHRMKYPLSIINWLLQDFGSDIMCAFMMTLRNSSLGNKAVAFRLSGVVPAFHGHVHNWGCQCQWHPLFVEGVGIEDFEECERTFCRSNELASVTRLPTPFHRQQHIDEHFYFHDLDKHASSGIFLYFSPDHQKLIELREGNFIYQNYRQALEKIQIESVHLAELSTKLKIGPEDYENYLMEERKYLAGLRTEPANEQGQAEYMELLFDLDSLL